MNERSGTAVADALGQHNLTTTGTVVAGYSGPMWGGGSFLFDGTSGYITAYDIGDCSLLTFECWVRCPSLAATRSTLWSDRGNPGVSFALGPGLVGGSAAYNASIEEDAGNTAWGMGSTGQSVNNDLWHHIVATISGTNAARMNTGIYTVYVDGLVARSPSADTYGDGNSVFPFHPDGGVIGRSTQGDRYYKGYLSEFAIYGNALTAAEIRAHYLARG
jgi:hypothetical protein